MEIYTRNECIFQEAPKGSVPAFLLDREGVNRTKVLTNMVKQKRKEKAGKWTVKTTLETSGKDVKLHSK